MVATNPLNLRISVMLSVCTNKISPRPTYTKNVKLHDTTNAFTAGIISLRTNPSDIGS